MPRGQYDRKAMRERRSLIVNGFTTNGQISSDKGVADPGIIYKYNERDTFPQSHPKLEKVDICESPKLEKEVEEDKCSTEKGYEGRGLSVEELVWVRKLREVVEGMGGMGREEECVCFHCRTVVRRVVSGIVEGMRKVG